MRVGPTVLLILLAALAIAPNTPLLSVRSCFISNLGFDNCNPTCLVINSGPLGASKRNLPIRKVSTIEALRAPIIPPLTKPSSNLVNLSLVISLPTCVLLGLSRLLMSV